MVVSNLLSSPASGEKLPPTLQPFLGDVSFQFIEFPSEWGVPLRSYPGSIADFENVSNLLSSPASGELHLSRVAPGGGCFQFIEFPSEWGDILVAGDVPDAPVSNLLSSPASGESSMTLKQGRGH